MNKSLLELLEEEKRAVCDARFFSESQQSFLEHIGEDGFNEDACRRISANYAEKQKEAESRIISVRKEIKEYIHFLEKMI